MESSSATLTPRNLAALLDETFSVYGRHLWRFLLIAAVVEAPISVLSFAVAEVWGWGTVTFLATALLGAFGGALVYSAAIFAVGQQYLTGEIDVRRCYERAFWRIKSLAMLTFVILAIVSIGPMIALFAGRSPLAALAVLVVFPAAAIAIYWSLAVQAVVVEGRKVTGALRRSFTLVQGSWWRILGLTLVFGLVILGLSILVSIPFVVLSLPTESGETTALGVLARFVGDLVVSVIVPPVLFIGGTLIYYDVRLKKEEYDFSALSREMGIATV